MYSYIPPIDDYRFLLNEVLGFDAAMAEIGKDVDADLAAAVRTLMELELELQVKVTTAVLVLITDHHKPQVAAEAALVH